MNNLSKFCILFLALVLSCTMVPVVIAKADHGGMALESPSLTMARFYIVDSEGRSVPDANVPSEEKQQDKQSLQVPSDNSKVLQRDLSRKGRERPDDRDPTSAQLSASKAWQCERHGFFFTADGRCIRPIIQVLQSPVTAISRRPIRSNLATQ